jgi:hypothetical protein
MTAVSMPRPEEVKASPEGDDSPSPELLEKVGELLSHAELLDIRPCAITARVDQSLVPGTPVESVEMKHAVSFAIEEGFYGNRLDYSFQLNSDIEDQPLGTIEFSLLIDYAVADEFKADPEAADFVASTTGYFAAFPYARELFESLATRLRFDPIVLGLIKRGSIRPGSISVAPRRIAISNEFVDAQED